MARTCSKCGQPGHNARTCTTPAKKKTREMVEKAAKKAKLKDPAAPPPKPPPDPAPTPEKETATEETPPDSGGPPPIPAGAKLTTAKVKLKRGKAQEAFWKATEKKLAPGSIASAGDLSLDIPRISTGCFGTDLALFRGVPQGRIVRPYGEPKAGKTGWCLNLAAHYQQNHCSECFLEICDCKGRDVPEVLWVDAEHRMNKMLHWPKAHGINLDRFRVLEPPTGQNVVDVVDLCIRESKVSKVGLIFLDSLAHIVSQEEINKPTLDGVVVGRNAMLLNSAWRKWTSALNSLGINNPSKPTIICINQLRLEVGKNYGNPETVPGGEGQKYASTVDIRFGKGYECFVVWTTDAKHPKGAWVAKEKKHKGYKPKEDDTADFVQSKYRVTASGHCPPGRFGVYNYWLKSVHGHRVGDPDNGLQLWQYAKKYNLIEVDGQTKKLYGLEATTYDELEALFRAHPGAQKKAWKALMKLLCE